jgi:hypothetical protein
VRGIYQKLGIQGFETNLAPQLEAEAAKLRAYKTNAHRPLPAELREIVERRWASYTQAWGYEWSR